MVSELYKWVGFVVFQADVVPRLVTFDQIRFEQQCLGFGVSDRKLDAVGRPDHPPDAVAPGVSVGANPRANVDGFADVEHRLAVVKLVDARLLGGSPGPFSKRLDLHSASLRAQEV